MDRRDSAVILPVAVLLIIVVAMLTFAVIYFSPIGTGTKVTITGQVQHLGGDDYSVSYISNSQEKDEFIFNFEQPGLFFWGDQDLKAKLFMNGNEIGSTKLTSGTFWASPENFDIIGRHISPGDQEFEIKLYRMVGGFLGFGGEEVYTANTIFTIIVDDYGNN